MWELNSSFQLISTAWAVLIGAVFCLFYDFLRAFRKVKYCGAVRIFFEDVCFSAFFGITVFCYLLATTNGEVRGYVLFGLAVGFIISRLTVSVFFLKLLVWLFSAFLRVFRKVSPFIYGLFDRFLGLCAKICKKCLQTAKKLLKKSKRMLYTNKS